MSPKGTPNFAAKAKRALNPGQPMNDAAIWFALIALAVTGWGYAFALAMVTKQLRGERSEILQDVGKLESLLKAARKNDNRDNKGRYAKA